MFIKALLYVLFFCLTHIVQNVRSGYKIVTKPSEGQLEPLRICISTITRGLRLQVKISYYEFITSDFIFQRADTLFCDNADLKVFKSGIITSRSSFA